MRGTEAADPRLVLEIALVRLARRESNNALHALSDRLDRLEARLADGGAPTTLPSAGPPPSPTASGSRASARRDPAPLPDAPLVTPPIPGPPARASGAKPPALGALRKAAGRGSDPAAEPSDAAPPPDAASTAAPAPEDASPVEVTFDLDDAILAWAAVLDALPRALRASIQEAQPVKVNGNVIVFGVAQSHIDTVRPKFQRNADAIREAFIAQLGGPPRFSFTQQDWGAGEGPPHRLQVVPEPEPEPVIEEEPIDLAEVAGLDDAPNSAGAAVDSLSRLTDAFGATVVDEQPKS
jgi:DNA polymerase-3 subunit gamma/tau